MITEHSHFEQNDWQEPGAGQSFASDASEASAQSPQAQLHSTQEHATAEESSSPGAPTASTPDETPTPTTDESQPLHQQANEPETEQHDSTHQVAAVADKTPQQAAGRAFTDFIEEFRQTEERWSAFLNAPEPPATAFVVSSETIIEPVVFPELTVEDLAQVINSAPERAEGTTEVKGEPDSASLPPVEAAQPSATPPAERPVSPLLRPASRLRMPRHGRHRVEEPVPAQETQAEGTKVSSEQQPATRAEKQGEEQQPARPARRYRFDRPAATASASLSSAKASSSLAPARGVEAKEQRNGSSTSHHQQEQPVSTEPALAHSEASALPASTAPQAPLQETAPTSTESSTSPTPTSERRRRGNHERQRGKEQAATVVAPSEPEQEIAPKEELAPSVESEVPVEDLPPLEYAELQAANSRRRRRRRIGGVAPVAPVNGTLANGALNGASTPKPLPDVPAPTPAAPAAAQAKSAALPQDYNIVSGYTVNQMNRGNDVSGPFMGPEPSPARGSTFTPAVRRMRSSETLPRVPSQPVKSGENPLMSTAAVNHLANVVSQAIQTQTDRMVAELRRSNQVPTNVSVSLPPFPSTERVGVFVDVANLLYSARTLRMTIDFGKLLDFLRGNRRLVRAQAYCPTSPQPGDDQMFLQAVKGLGYRITTKNYKTFSSGAKKADMDLDLCMDIVRLVDGGAVDCIVLVSGDSDFIPVLDYCSDHGVRVEVAAFDESMSATLRQACDLFVNLSMLEEIRA